MISSRLVDVMRAECVFAVEDDPDFVVEKMAGVGDDGWRWLLSLLVMVLGEVWMRMRGATSRLLEVICLCFSLSG